jgi:hypothetical protein
VVSCMLPVVCSELDVVSCKLCVVSPSGIRLFPMINIICALRGFAVNTILNLNGHG